MIRLTCTLVIALFGILVVTPACAKKSASPEQTLGVEVVFNDDPLPKITDARVIVLPTGERVFLATGADGLATCCLLPPKPVPTVEK